MAEPTFTGIGVALITLFEEDGAVDVTATVRHAGRLVEAGVRAVLVAGTTGEARDARGRRTRGAHLGDPGHPVPGVVAVIAGASATWPRGAATRAVAARKAGADTVLVSPARAGVDAESLLQCRGPRRSAVPTG